MKVRAIDGNNDWTFGRGKGNYVSDANAVAQLIKTRLQSFIGDCFFAQSDGIDWFNRLGSKNLTQLKLDISATILNTENVTAIYELSFFLSKERKMTIQYSVNTIYGKVTGETIQG